MNEKQYGVCNKMKGRLVDKNMGLFATVYLMVVFNVLETIL